MRESKILIVAGDVSGDLHASRLIQALRKAAPNVRVFAAGGPMMRAAGANMVASLEGLSVMGFTEVLSKLPAFYSLMQQLKRFMQHEQPQLVIAIDFPGFNLRLCKEAKKLGISVLYYIAPQIWAWGKNRINLMAKVVDKVAVVFPFELDIYRKRGLDASFVGHPLLEAVSVGGDKGVVRRRLGLPTGLPLVALLPGSRIHEVRRLLPRMLESADLLAQRTRITLAVGAASSVPGSEFERMTRGFRLPVRVLRGVTSELLYVSDVAVVASGSATLEAAIVGTPMVILYGVSPVSWFIARKLVALDYVGMVNIVAGRKIVSEYLQNEIEPGKISTELHELIFNERKRSDLIARLASVRDSLGGSGASEKVAAIALGMLPG
ncbi:MAG: lipid-A-disaccharide synthase [Candidatus Eisenbacteria bacterium]|nr:lipid-A-disaccharide synthase [Candidatus Eisenbacteria bacterium]